MANTIKYTRNDIDNLASKLLARAGTMKIRDPELSANMVAAAKLLRWCLQQGCPVGVAEVEGNGSSIGSSGTNARDA
jgi:hypothetical protein